MPFNKLSIENQKSNDVLKLRYEVYKSYKKMTCST